MKDANEEIAKEEEEKLKQIYPDFIRTLISIVKNVSIKDLKSLDINYRLINKYRRELEENDFIYLNNTFIKPRFDFSSFSKPSPEEPNFNFNLVTLDKCQQSIEVYSFVFLILLGPLILATLVLLLIAIIQNQTIHNMFLVKLLLLLKQYIHL